MKSLNSEIAENVAKKYVINRYNPFESGSYFSWYAVVVGEDETHQPESIYANPLPISEVLINSVKDAINIFDEKCDLSKEFLVKVTVDFQNQKLVAKILRTP